MTEEREQETRADEHNTERTKEEKQHKRHTKRTSAKLSELEEENRNLKEQLKEYQQKYLRALADLENYKKFSTKEYARLLESTKKEIFLGLLNIVDNFERALKHSQSKDDPFFKGVEMIYKSLLKFLADYGVKPFEAVGKAFDHNYHDAVEYVESDEHDEHTVLEEHLRGYMYKDEVLRHARVAVSKKTAASEDAAEEEKQDKNSKEVS